MGVKTLKELNFFTLYEKFINDSKRGKRLQPNGKRISPGTIDNYYYTMNSTAQVRATWKKLDPYHSFKGMFYDDEIQSIFSDNLDTV